MEITTHHDGDSKPVAIVDIGSNTIKGLLAVRRAGGEVVARKRETTEVRISSGSWEGKRMLSEHGMATAVLAVSTILRKFSEFAPSAVRIIATSAVRDAANGREFAGRVRAATGHDVEIISGEQEALLICRGMLCDPGLRNKTSFDLFDLGGGSLEIIQYRDGKLRKALSLPLGCVRLMERHHPLATEPMPPESREELTQEVRAAMEAAGLVFDLPAEGVHVGTGGTFTTVRGILAGEAGKDIHHQPSRLPVADIDRLADLTASQTIAARRTIPRLPPGRADVFPTALLTLSAVARHAGVQTFRHSFYNLRFGIAAEMLGAS
jgi:exopolyphosphatase/guanosine-5'-triphosphate,3'-diphosphate pyrophosphatase